MASFKKSALISACIAGVFAACNKSETVNRCLPVTTAAPTTEVTALQTELASKGISVSGVDLRGFFYNIGRQGDTSKRPTVCSTVKVSYTLRLLNGAQLEANNNISFSLTGLIAGWQEGLPLIGKGGFITLYLPPSLAYGASGSGSVPANTNLQFQIDLVDVQ